MIKRTLCFNNPAYLSFRLNQLVVGGKEKEEATVPIEDIGVILLDNPQITLTQVLLYKLLHSNVAVISCDDKHMPVGLFQVLEGHSLQAKRFEQQRNSSVPQKKQLWAQTITEKIGNQSELLKRLELSQPKLDHLAQNVQSGDKGNKEATAANIYWSHYLLHPVFTDNGFFSNRDRYGDPPNQLLNYGYSIVRAMTARALVASGLNPTYGIHHKNQYNAYALADDIMEPYRPFVDALVVEICEEEPDVFHENLRPPIKARLLEVASIDVKIEGKNSPLLQAIHKSASSLAKCFDGTARKILYPSFL